ncbi:MAG TPA: glycosyltransferase family 9 protein, partial [Turneriella sp.]|nr:glycosyltransferase family 9 protein [Turneriella sp.]
RHRKNKYTLQLKTEYTTLVREVAAYRFDIAIFSYAEKHSARLIQDAGIPYRLGPLRRSFFTRFNLWYYINRKKSNQAEYQLNLKMLRSLRLQNTFQFPRVNIPSLSAPSIKDRYIVIHPYKRSGTALVWPIENFQNLARYFTQQKIRVVILGDQSDSEVLHSHFEDISLVEIRTDLSLVQSAALIRGALHFFGNSSGPLHLAALVGTPHTGFYPQNRASSARRWRTLPLASAPFASQYLLNTNFPMDVQKCIGKKCKFYPCTVNISLEAAIQSTVAWKSFNKKSSKKKIQKTTKKKVQRKNAS